MQLEDYFEIYEVDDIRLKGTRIGIEHILDEYLAHSRSPEEITQLFPTLRLEQVYATILYYLQNQQKVGKYLENWINDSQKAEEDYDKNLPNFVKRLLKIKEERKLDLGFSNNDH